MNVPHLLLLLIAWLIALAWFFKLIEAALGLRTIPNLLRSEYDTAAGGSPSIAVIVPARNEEKNVSACLESLISQDYENLRIVGVDDRSSDQTGSMMDVLAEAHRDRFEVMHIDCLPAGWLGKTHAMATAARHAIAVHGPDYLLFTDADIAFQVDAIRRSLVYASTSQADHLVVLPTTIAKSNGEGMILAYLQVMSLWAVRPWRVADPKAKRDAIGVGAFNLIRATSYEQLGGFEATPMEILEDITLGRRVKLAGLRQRVATAPGMISLHWAAGALGLVNGMTKNLFALFQFRQVLLVGAAMWIALFCFVPVVFLGIDGVRLPAAIFLISVAGLYVLSSRSNRLSPFFAALFPVATIVMIYSMVRSMLITMRDDGVTWRGTFYPLIELRKHYRQTNGA